jgi:uncharacterized protein YozE (UPF0346 family)
MTFYTWLAKQTKRDDLVGDLAGDVIRDAGFPKDAPPAQAARYLRERFAFADGQQAVTQALQEYQAQR